MRDLLLMRGVPGCGKSSFIKLWNLEPYTICPDEIRLMFQSPVLDPKTGRKSISQKNDKKVWNLVYELVESRMERGEFVVIDAMNIDISSWKKLSDKYRYRIWYQKFDASLEECIYRNNIREEYKQVPEEVIRNAYKRIQETPVPSYAKEASMELLHGAIKPLNVDKYENIYVFGDIHGCFEPLDKFFKENPYSENNLYVFLGDYLDRGFENKETLEFLMDLSKYDNVMFLEGNHNWERYWANDEIDKIRSKEFLVNTVNQIGEIDKSKVREWCRKWIQMAFLEFNGLKYFMTHAGMGFFPKTGLRTVPTFDMIKGGKYEDDVDRWYEESEVCDIYQIHGHRNYYGYAPNHFTKSFNLNSAVEFGDDLRVMKITKSGYEFLYFENERCKGRPNPWKRQQKETDNIALSMSHSRSLTPNEQLVLELCQSPDIIEKPLKNGISSFNFKRDVFFSGKWSELSEIARGLFVDLSDCSILARSYRKFFNFEEGDKNTLEFLERKLEFPVSGYVKYNGFLGMMCYDHKMKDLHFFSKSTDESDFAKWFKDIAIAQFKRAGTLEEIKDYLRVHNVTMVFEVIDPVNDPHIIEYQYKRVWLLDVISNSVDFYKIPYGDLCELAGKLKMSVKKREVVFYDFNSLKSYLKSEVEFSQFDKPTEGLVFEDANGYMFKYKFEYYNFWKKMRGVKQQISKGKPYGKDKLSEFGKEVAQFMIDNYTLEQLENKSIVEIRKEFEGR